MIHICLPSHLSIDLGQMTLDLKKQKISTRLTINANNTKVLSLVDHHILAFCVQGQNNKDIKQLAYQDITISAETSIKLDISRSNNI